VSSDDDAGVGGAASPGRPVPTGFLAGCRDGAPLALVAAVVGTTFGIVATAAGMPVAAALLLSVLVYSAAVQFSVVAVLVAGGGLGAAVVATALVTARMLPMGLALGPSLHGGRLRRAVEGQALIDPAWVMAARPGGRFDREYLFGNAAVQWVGWVSGSVAGLAGLHVDVRALGLDALFPAFFLTLVCGEAPDRLRLAVGLGAAATALLLVPVAPVGVPVLAGGLVALVGLRAPGRPA
jgi:predicted branched-subunit amino acid permease